MKLIDELIKRFNKKKTIGLALSGGSTYGAAHIGVLRVLEQAGIKPDYVTGTSAGAIIGSAYCAGVPLDEIEQLFLTIGWPTLVKISIHKPRSIFDTQPMEKFLKNKIGDIEFNDLKIPFAAMACDIHTGERIVLDQGPVARAVRASAAIPVLFSPVEIDDRLLVDGGIVDDIPVEHLRTMNTDYIIASDVSRKGKINKKPDNMFEIMMAMFYIMQDRAASINEDDCDCYIRPQILQYSPWGFGDAPKMIEAGRVAAEALLPKLKKDLKLKPTTPGEQIDGIKTNPVQ